MNKIETGINGGFPLTQEVWAHTHDGIADAFKGLVSAYGVDDSNAVILSGCERSVSLGDVTITEGYVSIGGEVCYFPEQVFTEPVAPDDLEYFEINTSYVAAGNVAFETSGNHDTREVRTAKVTAASSVPVGHTAYSDAKRLFELIREGVDISVWNTFADYHNDIFYGPGNTPASEFRKYLKDIDGFVHLKGMYLQDGASATDVTMCQLPVGFRPIEDMLYGGVHIIDHTTAYYFKVKIKTNGDVMLLTPGTAVNVYFNELVPFRTT